jgi:hypothetical protein
MKFEPIARTSGHCATVQLASARAIDKTGRVMFADALPLVRRWLNIMLSRPLTAREAVVSALALLWAGTIYCQLYCFLALQQMHGATMPLSASVHRASVDIVPPLVVFELGKRISFENRMARWLALIALFAAGFAVAVAWRMQLQIMASMLTPRRMAVDRIPFMALAALALLLFHKTTRSIPSPIADEPPEPLELPPPRSIDWINAAGNYVEVHFAGHAKLFRMTLQQAKDRLPPGDFIQIHRSTIVNRSRISKIEGAARTVGLEGGATLKVGETYRNAVRQAVNPLNLRLPAD